jgi:hypothetical protein
VAAIIQAFELCPQAGAVGGRVDPIWGAPRPSWLSDHVARALTIVDWSAEPKVVSDLSQEWLVGANMAVRADLLSSIGGFRPELDRVGTRMLSGGDIYLLKQIMRTGAACFYYPPMTVSHTVPADRLTQRWFRRRYYWQGVSDAVMRLLDADLPGTVRRQLARRALMRLALSPRRLASLLPTTDPNRFTQTCWTLIDLGHAMGLHRLARVPLPQHPVS